ncbi:unnamed protein product [Didymodactylos carnosus]|uniref:ZZ-type domain-containing protein n=1 Tax=Didymodactylos carnosus TaxID=1234261 RepID=A0A8S2DW52_9BILA|nr:unnamed protein product [Didymodactylos carnosus]CAF3786728.1 unnamed protein product [Didymodactylos carnosus]
MIPWLLGMSLSRNRADETDDNRYLDNTDTNSPPPEEMFLQSLDHPHFPSLERYLGADDYFDYIKDDDPYDTRKMRQHSKQCYHPDHDTERPAHSTDCRPASLDVSSRIQGFPIGGCFTTSKTICAFWDASLSRSTIDNRNLEINLLNELLKIWLSNSISLKLTLVIFRNVINEKKIFQLTNNNDLLELINYLKTIHYDDATNLSELSSMVDNESFTHYFLFSDCLSTIGNDNDPSMYDKMCSIPIWIINGNYLYEPVNYSLINYLTQRSSGGYISRDKMNDDISSIIDWINSIKSKYLTTNVNQNLIQDIYPSHSVILTPNQGRFLIVGKLLSLSTSITIELEFNINNQIHRQQFILNPSDQSSINVGLIRRLWAQQKLQELSVFKDKNKQIILDIGMKYSIVTDLTSIMVLETLQQHIQYRICPAKSRTKLYNDYMKHRQTTELNKQNKFTRLLNSWQQRCQWYDKVITDTDHHRGYLWKEFSTKSKSNVGGFGVPFTPFYSSLLSNSITPQSTTSISGFSFGAAPVTTSSTFSNTFGSTTTSPFTSAFGNSIPAQSTTNVSTFAFGAAPSLTNNSFSLTAANSSNIISSQGAFSSAIVPENKTVDSNSTIILKEYDPQAPYMSRIKSSSSLDGAYEIYLSERQTYRQSPSFYFDVASYFLSSPIIGQTSLDIFNNQYTLNSFSTNVHIQSSILTTNEKSNLYGLRILTNILELELESVQLLRTVAYKLTEMNLNNLAENLFRKILNLHSDEPQSYRDLALVLLTSNKDNDEIFYLFQKIIDGEWDISRFYDFEIPVLHELNCLLAISTHHPNIIDPRLIRHLPCDLRIVLVWDISESMIDLSITEPTSENCSQYHSETFIGGMMNQRTGGLKEYLLRKAINGTYLINVSYANNRQQTGSFTGVTTVMITIYKYYGQFNEQKQILTGRLNTIGQTIEIGKVEFGDRSQEQIKLELEQYKNEYQRLLNELNKSKHAATNNSIKMDITHPNVSCDRCNMTPIKGVRYKCLLCPNTDYCNQCQLNDDHPLLCIKDSTQYSNSILLQNRCALVHLNTQCSLCAMNPIVGIRYQCSCGIEICEKCEFMCTHDLTHVRAKIIYS